MLELIEQEGVTALGARHGQEAIDLLRSGQRPSLILLDLKMPVMDGWAFCEALGADERFASIPVAILTASAIYESLPQRRKRRRSLHQAGRLPASPGPRSSLLLADTSSMNWLARLEQRTQARPAWRYGQALLLIVLAFAIRLPLTSVARRQGRAHADVSGGPARGVARRTRSRDLRRRRRRSPFGCS
jgi:CheY-like chemotaxis protein